MYNFILDLASTFLIRIFRRDCLSSPSSPQNTKTNPRCPSSTEVPVNPQNRRRGDRKRSTTNGFDRPCFGPKAPYSQVPVALLRLDQRLLSGGFFERPVPVDCSHREARVMTGKFPARIRRRRMRLAVVPKIQRDRNNSNGRVKRRVVVERPTIRNKRQLADPIHPLLRPRKVNSLPRQK